MEWSLYDSITRQVADSHTSATIVYDLHNEPLMNPDILDWIRHMKLNAPASRCALITNGALLNRFDASDIDASKVDLLAVSLNAHSRDTYEQLNCGLDFDQVVENILRIADVSALRSRLRVDFVATRANRNELAAACAFWNERGVRTFCKPLHNRAGALVDYDRFVPSAATPAGPIGGLLNSVRRRFGCLLPFNQMSVLHNGDAILCCHDWDHACVLGSVAERSLRDIWNGPELQHARRALVSGNIESLEPCRDCSVARHRTSTSSARRTTTIRTDTQTPPDSPPPTRAGEPQELHGRSA